MKYDIFLSYNRQDVESTRGIASVLERAGFGVFFDEHKTESASSSLDDYLKAAIRDSRRFALVHGQNCLGNTQKKEADYALSQSSSIVQDFRNVMLTKEGECKQEALSRCALPGSPYATNHQLIEGTPFELTQKLLDWLQRVEEIGGYRLSSFGGGRARTRLARLYRISQPDIGNIVPLDWRAFEALLGNLLVQLEHEAVCPDVLIGISGSGLVIASFIAHKLEPRPPIGYVKHEGPSRSRRLVEDHFALPKISDGAEVLLVDSELKTGSAIELIVNHLKAAYPHVEFSFAALCAQLSVKYEQPDNAGFPPGGSTIKLKDLLAAQGIEKLGLREVFFGGLFGAGRINFLREIK